MSGLTVAEFVRLVAWMKNATPLFIRRFAKLDAEISRLEAERAMLVRFQNLLGAYEHVLRDDDHFSTRTLSKFELLARVVKHLNQPDPFMYGGSSTKEIYKAVLAEILTDKQAAEWSKFLPDRGQREASTICATPLEQQSEALNYNTFRSYLARFRSEGRVFFNAETRRWHICDKEITTSNFRSDWEESDERD